MRDDKEQDYLAITAIKNYLGERWGFWYAFIYFFSTWFSIPALFGVGVGWYQWQGDQYVTIWSIAYSLVMSFWFTIFELRWTRKENELKMMWGVLVKEDSQTNRIDKIRPEYIGNEWVDPLNGQITKKDINRKLTLFWRFASVMILFLFIGICISVFLFFSQVKSAETQFS